jgi:hypothetical protein
MVGGDSEYFVPQLGFLRFRPLSMIHSVVKKKQEMVDGQTSGSDSFIPINNLLRVLRFES